MIKKCKDHLGNEYASIQEMCKHYGIKYEAFFNRVNVYGYSLEEALTTANQSNKNRVVEYKGITYPTFRSLCQALGKNYFTIKTRVRNGMSLDEALNKN